MFSHRVYEFVEHFIMGAKSWNLHVICDTHMLVLRWLKFQHAEKAFQNNVDNDVDIWKQVLTHRHV